MSTPKLCRCGAIVFGQCKKCDAPPPRKKRKRNSRWKKVAERHKQASPLCEICLERGIVRASEESHHIVAISIDPSKELDTSNLMALCYECHHKVHEENA